MVIGADGVTSHWGEMELKICPDGQNKGFGHKSGKQRKEGGIRKRKCGGDDGAGGRKTEWKTTGWKQEMLERFAVYFNVWALRAIISVLVPGNKFTHLKS